MPPPTCNHPHARAWRPIPLACNRSSASYLIGLTTHPYPYRVFPRPLIYSLGACASIPAGPSHTASTCAQQPASAASHLPAALALVFQALSPTFRYLFRRLARTVSISRPSSRLFHSVLAFPACPRLRVRQSTLLPALSISIRLLSLYPIAFPYRLLQH